VKQSVELFSNRNDKKSSAQVGLQQFAVPIAMQKFPSFGGVAKIQRIFDGVVNNNFKVNIIGL